MVGTTSALFRLLIILFVFDIIKKYFLKPKSREFHYEQNNTIIDDVGKNNLDKQKKINKSNNNTLLIIYDKNLHLKDFDRIKEEIEKKYSNLFVKGEEYSINESRKMFSKFTYITQIGVSILLLFPKYLHLGLPFLSQNTIQIIDKYKHFIILGNFIVHYTMNRFLSTSGAFEIYYNEKLIYSKLQTKNLPSISNIEEILKKLHLKKKKKDDTF